MATLAPEFGDIDLDYNILHAVGLQAIAKSAKTPAIASPAQFGGIGGILGGSPKIPKLDTKSITRLTEVNKIWEVLLIR